VTGQSWVFLRYRSLVPVHISLLILTVSGVYLFPFLDSSSWIIIPFIISFLFLDLEIVHRFLFFFLLFIFGLFLLNLYQLIVSLYFFGLILRAKIVIARLIIIVRKELDRRVNHKGNYYQIHYYLGCLSLLSVATF